MKERLCQMYAGRAASSVAGHNLSDSLPSSIPLAALLSPVLWLCTLCKSIQTESLLVLTTKRTLFAIAKKNIWVLRKQLHTDCIKIFRIKQTNCPTTQ